MEKEESEFTQKIKLGINPPVKALPVNNPREKFEKDVVPTLQEIKGNKEAREIAQENGVYVGNPGWHNFLVGFFIISIILGIGFLCYLAYTDHFKSEVYQSLSCPEINISIPKCPACGNLSCPQQICNVTCPATQINVFNGSVNSS